MGWCLHSRLAHPLGCSAACQLRANGALPFGIIDSFEDVLDAIDSHSPPRGKNSIYWQHLAYIFKESIEHLRLTRLRTAGVY